MKTSIVMRLTYGATHHWPGEPQPSRLNLVESHFHHFQIEIRHPVHELDREIEFIQYRAELYDLIDRRYEHNFGARSCEMIATDLREHVAPYATQISVFEDDFVGAVVEF